MASYLDQYGAGEEKRENIIKFSVIGLVLAVVLGFLGYYVFKNHSEEVKVRAFLEVLRKKDYTGAYGLWGCTQATPCANYSYDKFMEDWGPKASGDDSPRLADSQSCNAGVILTVDVSATKQERLWVEKQGGGLGFSPFEVCPNTTPLSNMVHQTIGKFRKPFLN